MVRPFLDLGRCLAMELLEDPPRRASMGDAGRQRAEHMFTLIETIRALMSVLDELIGA